MISVECLHWCSCNDFSLCSTRRGSSVDVTRGTSTALVPRSPRVSVSSQLEGESSPRDVVDATAGPVPAASLVPQPPISVESDEEDLFSTPIPDFNPLAGMGGSLKEPVL